MLLFFFIKDMGIGSKKRVAGFNWDITAKYIGHQQRQIHPMFLQGCGVLNFRH